MRVQLGRGSGGEAVGRKSSRKEWLMHQWKGSALAHTQRGGAAQASVWQGNWRWAFVGWPKNKRRSVK